MKRRVLVVKQKLIILGLLAPDTELILKIASVFVIALLLTYYLTCYCLKVTRHYLKNVCVTNELCLFFIYIYFISWAVLDYNFFRAIIYLFCITSMFYNCIHLIFKFKLIYFGVLDFFELIGWIVLFIITFQNLFKIKIFKLVSIKLCFFVSLPY